MAKKNENVNPEPEVEVEQTETVPETASEAETAPETGPSELEQARADLAKEHDQYLRLAAEYDNFRKRSQKEKDNIYRDAQADTIG